MCTYMEFDSIQWKPLYGHPLNIDTWISWTLWHDPLVSVLTGFYCNLPSCPAKRQVSGFEVNPNCFNVKFILLFTYKMANPGLEWY